MIKYSKEGDNIYANIKITNPQDATNAILAEIRDHRTLPFVKNIEDYYLAIVRFRVPSGTLPIFAIQIQDGINQTDPNLTVYSVTLSVGGNDYTEYLKFVPDNATSFIPTPQPPSERPSYGYTQEFGPYYYVYFVSSLVAMINTALGDAFTTMKANNVITATEAPYLLYEADTSLLSFIIPYEYVADGIDIWWNFRLQRFLNQFRILFYGYGSPGNQLNSKLIYDYTGNQPYYKQLFNMGSPATAKYIKVDEEVVNVGSWFTVRNLIFTSYNIPIISENISGLDGGGNPITQPIITDFSPNITNRPQFRTDFEFNNTGPYRLLDLMAEGDQNILDIKISWQDALGFISPLYLAPGDTVEIKLLFINKEMYRTNLDLV